MQRTITLSPYGVPSRALARLRALQPVMQKLYAAAARDPDFLHAALGGSAGCAWCAEELAVFRRVETAARAKPLLLLPNSVFLWPDGDDDAAPVLSVGNVQAGEPHQLELVHALQSAEHADVEGGPLATACATLAAAARLVHPSRQCVAVVTKPAERLAVRTRLDVLGVGARLQREHGVDTVLYVSMDDLAGARLDASGDLMLDGHRISVLYSRCGAQLVPQLGAQFDCGATLRRPIHALRYDFSHPSGSYLDAAGAAALEQWSEWPTIERIEASNAVLSSDLGCRLAHRRMAQHALSRSGAVERFLSPAEAAEVRRVLPRQWALGDASEREEARALVDARGAGAFVAKNLLRPRTGSNRTQDRHASGGALVADAEAIAALVASADDATSARYVLYERVVARTHAADLAHHGDRLHLPRAISEVASYGALLVPPGEGSGGEGGGGEGGGVNVHAGFGARTRPAAADHPLAAELGYGALGCVQRVGASER